VNDGSQKPPGYAQQTAQQPWMAQGPTQPWGAPSPNPYGAPIPPSPPQSAQNPYAAPYAQPGVAVAQAPSQFGDSAGEHMGMTRGRYGATVYVFFAFLMEIGIVTALFAALGALLGAVANLDDDVTGMITLAAAGTGFCGGAVLAYFVFRDRWKCIEAFSSRFCSGLMNLSLMYVPFIALVYANIRGIQKLSGK
jgi:hypothetical protein